MGIWVGGFLFFSPCFGLVVVVGVVVVVADSGGGGGCGWLLRMFLLLF